MNFAFSFEMFRVRHFQPNTRRSGRQKGSLCGFPEHAVICLPNADSAEIDGHHESWWESCLVLAAGKHISFDRQNQNVIRRAKRLPSHLNLNQATKIIWNSSGLTNWLKRPPGPSFILTSTVNAWMYHHFQIK
jgi:hypothetical protein